MNKKGQTILELLIIMAIAGMLLPVLYSAFISSRDGKAQTNQRFKAIQLLKETTEAVRTVREAGWINISTNGNYYPRISGSTYILSPTSPPGELTTGGLSRLITISSVQRNANGAIVSSGGNTDPSTKKIDIIISWTQPKTTSLSSTFYVTRYLENASYTETTQTQFNAGTKTGVTVRETSGSSLTDDGEIILGAGGNGNWCAPSLLASQVNLSGGIADSIEATEGRAYVGTGENASGLPFIYIGVNNPPQPTPPTPTQLGTSTLNYKSNSVAGDGNVGYFGSDSNSAEVVMINLAASPPYPQLSTFNAPGNGNGESIALSGNYGYVATGSNLYNFRKYGVSETLPIDSDGVTLTGSASRIKIVGNYAFVAVNSTTNQLNIIDISNPASLVRRGTLTVSSRGAQDIFVSTDGNRAYMVVSQGTGADFFIINTTSKTSPNLVTNGNWDTGAMDPKGVAVVPGNYALVVGVNGNEYQVLNIGTESSISACRQLDLGFSINAVAGVTEADGDVFAYILTNDGSGEFKIIAGGPGGSYSTAGTFESQTFNPGYTTANNRFQANFVEPAGTTIRFQVSMANLVNGSCPTTGYTFVGPSGTNSDWFEPASGESVGFPYTTTGTYSNPGQCLRYKVDMSTTSGTSTPVMEEITINYSP